MLVERDRLMILVIEGRRTDEHCFRREVGIPASRKISVVIYEVITNSKEYFRYEDFHYEFSMNSL